MNVLAIVFGALLLVALVTGKAYFRGVYARDDVPRKYWTIIACYAALLLAGVRASPTGRGDARKGRASDPAIMYWTFHAMHRGKKASSRAGVS